MSQSRTNRAARVGGAALIAALAGCASAPKPDAAQSVQRSLPLRKMPSKDATRPVDRTLGQRDAKPGPARSRAPEAVEVSRAGGAGRVQEAQAAPSRDLEVTLNFKQVDAREVFREIFEKVLKVDYVLAADLGSSAKEMSFILEGRVSHEELFRALDSVCEAYGLALVEQDGVVHVVAAKDAPKRAGPVQVGWDRVRENLTTGTYVLPLSNALATDVAEGLKSMLSDRGAAFSPKGTNVLVLVEGPANAERLLSIIGEFDQPAFASRVFRLYSPTYVTPKELADGLSEYAKALGVRTTAEATTQFTASVLPRSQQVFVTTTVRDIVPSLDAWFERLDKPLEGDQPVTHLYHVQHAAPGMLETAITAAFDRLPEGDKPVVTPISARQGSGASATTPATTASSQQGQTGGAGATRGGGLTGAGTSLPPLSAGEDTQGQTLLIRAKPGIYKEVRELIDMLDGPPKQVYLQVVVAEVTLTADLQFGVELFLRQEVDDIPWEIRSAASAVANPIGSAFILSGNAFALVEMAANDGNVAVLSAPYTIATTGKPAFLNVGSEVPIITQQISGTTDATDPNRINNSIEYRKAGVILTVTPRVNDSGEVALQIQQEVSDVVQPTAGAAIQSPSFSQRQIQTTVMVRSGDTAVLGGIRRDREVENETGIPLLKDLPLIGTLFRGKNLFREQTELVILVTPTIVISPQDLPEYTPEFLAGIVNIDMIDDLLMNTKVHTSEMLEKIAQ